MRSFASVKGKNGSHRTPAEIVKFWRTFQSAWKNSDTPGARTALTRSEPWLITLGRPSRKSENGFTEKTPLKVNCGSVKFAVLRSLDALRYSTPNFIMCPARV